MAAGLEVGTDGRVALGHRRQVDLAVGQLGLGVVLALDVGPQEAGELDDLARGARTRPPRRPPSAGRRCPSQADLGAGAGGVGHLEATVRFQIRS